MTMKAILTDENTRVLGEPTDEGLSIASVRTGEEMELGKVIRKRKEAWVEITLASGAKGYISGHTRIFVIKKVQLLSESAEMVESTAEGAAVLRTFAKKDIFEAIGVEKVEGLDWVHVRDTAGKTGYMRQNVKIKVYQEPTRAAGKKMMITGGIFALLGVVIFVGSLFQVSPAGDTSFLMIGLLALGGFQVIQGYVQYRQAVKKEEEGPTKGI
jgi:hypothetical protein